VAPSRGRPDPDPLGEVPFDSDPIFAAMRDLRGPYCRRRRPEEYLNNIDVATGVDDVYGAAVPLLMHDKTWGILVLALLQAHLVQAEINALQAVASMLVQLQARIDAEEQTIFNAITTTSPVCPIGAPSSTSW